jgi:hypothetical protein
MAALLRSTLQYQSAVPSHVSARGLLRRQFRLAFTWMGITPQSIAHVLEDIYKRREPNPRLLPAARNPALELVSGIQKEVWLLLDSDPAANQGSSRSIDLYDSSVDGKELYSVRRAGSVSTSVESLLQNTQVRFLIRCALVLRTPTRPASNMPRLMQA